MMREVRRSKSRRIGHLREKGKSRAAFPSLGIRTAALAPMFADRNALLRNANMADGLHDSERGSRRLHGPLGLRGLPIAPLKTAHFQSSTRGHAHGAAACNKGSDFTGGDPLPAGLSPRQR